MGSVSIDLSLSNIWKSWYQFRRGKRKTTELEHFQYFLEKNLQKLHDELSNDAYKHDGYRKFIVNDNKRREVSVASVKDRVAHRLLYEYLVKIYDKTFIFDAWSCRKEKGLVSAIERARTFLSRYSGSFIWRSDIKKFFDNVDHQILMEILYSRVADLKAIYILEEVIESYSAPAKECRFARRKGIPIGNLTSQIFANIYLNEFDRFVQHAIKPLAYLRYGDDFIVMSDSFSRIHQIKEESAEFLKERLGLEINVKSDIMVKARWGLKFLGVEIFPKGVRLSKRNWRRAKSRLNLANVPSYSGLARRYSKGKRIKEFGWIVLEKLNAVIE